ncbi:MAG: sigma-E processing peptidase SpoIIGA [Lachnospiraceae bacterium]|nr:sigma-E processing peptidase SpoIIGA [Lachnospiraceae bacterium]
MIRIYEVYIDIYFIENVMMDVQLLILVLLLLKEKIRWKRLLAATLAGGVGAVLLLVSGIRFSVIYVLSVLFLDGVMVFICTYHPTEHHRIFFRRPAMGIIYLHGMTSAYVKLMECVIRLVGVRFSRIVVTVVITGIVAFLVLYRRIAGQNIYDVTLTENGENIALRALFDTGNLLCDPVSGKPVSVMEETDEIRQWLAKYPQKYRIIPYQSVGNEHGILEGIVVDRMMIQKEEGQVVKKETIVALYKGKLSKDGTFQMILNHSLISA